MSQQPLALELHVVRYVYKNCILKDENDVVIGVYPQAFRLREGEKYLSVTSLEHFNADYELGFVAAVAALRRQLPKIIPRDGFTTGNVGKVHEVCRRCQEDIRIVHEPSRNNTGHSGIYRLPRDNVDLLAMLANEVFTDTRLSSAFP